MQPPKLPSNWLSWLALSCIYIAGASHAVAAEPACEEGWLAVQAQVMRLTPGDRAAERITPEHRRLPVRVGDLLCEGDELILPEGGAAELFLAGRVVQVDGAGSPHLIKAGARMRLAEASDYLRLAFKSLFVLAPPEARPSVTASRGGNGRPALSLAPIMHLEVLPRQRLTPDLSVVVAWRNGDGPFSCEAVNGEGTPVWTSKPEPEQSCRFGPRMSGVARLNVRDTRQRSTGWNVSTASWHDVPRPAWIAASASACPDGGYMGAWGIWLWQNGGAAWRLQSISMLDAASRHEWIAAYFLAQVLAEVPPLVPAT